MITRTATARYQGMGKDGQGWVSTQSGVLKDQRYGFNTRFENEPGTNPEELIAAAHSSCFAMQFSAYLAENGTPGEVSVSAVVEIEAGTIKGSALTVEGKAPGIDAAKFEELAQKAKANCPVSKALGAITVNMNAKLVA